ncbi:MAG: class I SAM-dependent methyltransferase [Deltaproteobacteria bacterium]|nr:class I SAM-dependent methyltransferase [Deltaproteobacteria bacterium]
MPNSKIFDAIEKSWAQESGGGKTLLDLSCGGGQTSRMLSERGFQVIATDYDPPPALPAGIQRVGGVDLNEFLPFKSGRFDAVNLVEVIEHIENQPRLIREIARVLKPEGVVLISTPNILNMLSRLRFVFTGFLRGRVRPVHYTRPPGKAPNIYLIHFYELYYLLFHFGFEVHELRKTKIKFAPLFFTFLLYPLVWIFSLEAIIRAEKDPVQRRYNWQILRWFFSWPLLLSDNIVVKARKIRNR